MKDSERTNSKRSAALRSQRSQREHERVSQASERARNPSTMPPVMSRGSMAGAPGTRRKATQTNVRRKVYYSLGASGAEVSLPSITMLRPSWRLLSGAMAIVLLAAIWAMWSTAMFQIGKINVIGVKRIPQAEISKAVDLEGVSILQANPDELQQALQDSFPDLSKASVQVGLPASVVVRVQERQPLINWQGDKQTVWVDASGMAFPPRGEPSGLIAVKAVGTPPAPPSTPSGDTAAGSSSAPAPTATPVATPLAPDLKPAAHPFLTADLISAIQKLSGQAPAKTAILYDARYGLGWKDPKGWTVYFGSNMDSMDLKLEQYKVITGELAKQKIVPAMISVEFPHAPFYRLEP
ncbi:MAG TPA: FtsQ-type POTRA domain-containing protein [Anaerolineaceae bacterium]